MEKYGLINENVLLDIVMRIRFIWISCDAAEMVGIVFFLSIRGGQFLQYTFHHNGKFS